MIPLAEAVELVRSGCSRLHPTAIPLDEALGCVTSVPLRSDEAVPPFANTAMDGFALRAADTVGAPVRLRVVGDLPAGRDPEGLHVGRGEAVRIMTGAPIPAGADAVVMVERTSRRADGDDAVVVEVEVPVGNHVRAAGEDLQPGQEVFPAFTVLRPGHLGLLATLGLRRVPVFPRARVGVLSTGDELVDGPVELRPGQIRDANRHSLMALAQEAGCEPIDLGLVGDDVDEVRAAIEKGLGECDALLTSGGVSMGDWDPVKVVVAELADAQQTSFQVAIKPAKPLSFATVDGKPIFGLPGNPASSMVSFELFARPALLAMMGHTAIERPRITAIAAEPFHRAADGKLHLVRVALRFDRASGRYRCRSAGGQGSNLLRSMAGADGLALIPDGSGVEAGADVEVVDLR